MCGICGAFDRRGEVDMGAVRAMAERISHRGPDGEGFWSDAGREVGLGHRRLSVLDLSERAKQPMVAASGAVLSFNGEVYNFRELRRELEADGRRFDSSGDTEVVLAALERWGLAALERFNGMFAFAYWNPRTRRLLLVRDRLGIKPLFWAELGAGLAFASELPALLAHPQLVRRLDEDAVARWLASGFLGGEATLFAGVHRLPPGHLLEVDSQQTTRGAWYDLIDRCGDQDEMRRDECVERLSHAVEAAVQCRLVSDVPLGCFLSGGVDSSVVTAAACRAAPDLESLTVSFGGGEDEAPEAARTAAALGVGHRRVRCTADSMEEFFGRWSSIAGDPLADPSLYPTWAISRHARERWTVALSGDGGDELLSGYPRLRMMPRLARLGGAPRALAAAATAFAPPRRWAGKLKAALRADSQWSAYQALQGVWPLAELSRLTGRRDIPLPWPAPVLARLDEQPAWKRFRLLDVLSFLPDRVLAKVDRASMSHGLEVRVPLLDHHVVELLLRAPPELAAGKGMLREVAARLGVKELGAKKRGFEVPLAAWLRGPLRDAVERDLDGPIVADLGLDRRVLRSLWREHQEGRADHAERLFAVAVLVRWVDAWL